MGGTKPPVASVGVTGTTTRLGPAGPVCAMFRCLAQSGRRAIGRIAEYWDARREEDIARLRRALALCAMVATGMRQRQL